MKKNVSPILAAVLILAALAAVQVLYWRGLLGQAPGRARDNVTQGHGGGERGPVGLEEVQVVTVAGSPSPGWRDGTGDEARFDGPAAVAVGGAAIYVADGGNHCVRAIDRAGEVTTIAGKPGKAGFRDGPAAEALFSSPAGVAVARDGSLLVSDTGNHRIRRIRNGVVTTLAGSATARDDLGREMGGYRDGPAREAEFRYPVGLAVDARGGVYVADAGNHKVRYISPQGVVTTVPAEGGAHMDAPTSVALTGNGLLVAADPNGGCLWVGRQGAALRKWSPPEGSGLRSPSGVAPGRGPDGGPALWVADCKTHSLFLVEEDAVILAAGPASARRPGWVDGAGSAARFSSPAGLASGPGGEVYVSDFGNNCVRRVSIPLGATGWAETGEPATRSRGGRAPRGSANRDRQTRGGAPGGN